jgi:hypothetical protein
MHSIMNNQRSYDIRLSAYAQKMYVLHTVFWILQTALLILYAERCILHINSH